MGSVQHHRPVLFIAAVFSRYPDAFEWFDKTAQAQWGPIELSSERFNFTETHFYKDQMGDQLYKQLFAFESLIDPELLPGRKLASNAWEQQATQVDEWTVERPLNIDPGYVTQAKLVLATTKDRDHRLYLGQGIYGEVTLFYRQKQWQTRPWTYPDYQQPAYHRFFDACRDLLRDKYRTEELDI